jgi:hypothetical protein
MDEVVAIAADTSAVSAAIVSCISRYCYNLIHSTSPIQDHHQDHHHDMYETIEVAFSRGVVRGVVPHCFATTQE